MKAYLLLLLLTISFVSNSQNPSTNSNEVKQIQPSIMVVPFNKKGQDIRTILESDFNLRMAISIMKQVFDKEGFSTSDFESKLRSLEQRNAFKNKDQSSYQDIIAQNSKADFLVILDIDVQKQQYNGTNVTVRFECVDAFTGNSLSNYIGESGYDAGSDVRSLIKAAVDDKKDIFLKMLDTKFTQIVEDGRALQIDFALSQDASITYEDEIDGDYISDLIDDWMAANAYKNNYSLSSVTETQIFYSDVRIPLRDQKTGKNYRATNFRRAIKDYLKKDLGLNCSARLVGAKIFIVLK